MPSLCGVAVVSLDTEQVSNLLPEATVKHQCQSLRAIPVKSDTHLYIVPPRQTAPSLANTIHQTLSDHQ